MILMMAIMREKKEFGMFCWENGIGLRTELSEIDLEGRKAIEGLARGEKMVCDGFCLV